MFDKEKDIKEIKQFLDENEIEYVITGEGEFCLYHGNPDGKRSYQIRYVRSEDYPIAYPKYGIEGVDQKYFYRLSREAEENNSFICWIKDYEWANDRKREVLKSYIMHQAGKTPNRWFARNTVVKEVPSHEGLPFEDTNCFYGRRGASLRLGLYSKKEQNGYPAGTLLILYTFGVNFFGKEKGKIEVLRVGTLRFGQVIGGASKLFKYFLRKYPILEIGKKEVVVEKVAFYSDFCHNLGSSMQAIGFDFVGYSEGGFMNMWKKEGVVKHRSPMHHKEVMAKMAKGEVLALPTSGVKTFLAKRSEIIDSKGNFIKKKV